MKIHLTRQNELAIITIDAPPLNLYALDLDAEFHDALDELGDARALLVELAGGAADDVLTREAGGASRRGAVR